jgi:SAM-dependent methyltransferase
MSITRRQEHWDGVYREKTPDQTSWYQADPAPSLALIGRARPDPDMALIDAGGGASLLADFLLERGFTRVTVLDISAGALQRARDRIGPDPRVRWIISDITQFNPDLRYGLWHDRALFHFLTDPGDRAAYLAALRGALVPGGQLVLGAFAMNGPQRCSGLEVVRYDSSRLGRELGQEFELLEEMAHVHTTPWGAEQQFTFFRYRYRPAGCEE